MKKSKIIILLFAVTLLAFCICLFFNFSSCNKENKPFEQTKVVTYYEIEYVIDGEIYLTETVLKGELLTAPVLTEKNGYIFKGWYTAEDYIDEWNFETDTVKSTQSLFGYWVEVQEETFNVIFKDGENLLECVKVKKGAHVTEIIAPEKRGYTFTDWYEGENKYDFSLPIVKDLTLNAEWKINIYTVSFVADANIVEQVNFTIEDMQISVPEVPAKQHYSSKWEEFNLTAEDIIVNAKYTPVTYSATIIIGELTNEIKYNVEEPVVLPEIPQRNGYTTGWDREPPEGEDFTIKAVYTPVIYYVSFKANGTIIKTCEYTVENNNVSPPAVPEIKGYTGSWEQKTYETGDITVNAEYSIITFTAKFIIDGEIFNTEYFDAKNMFIQEPEIPARTGYSASWENYALNYEDIEINAIFAPVQYTAYFTVDGSIYYSAVFTVEDTCLDLPAVPEKKGYSAVWESYAIEANDLFIKAIYTPEIYFVTFIAEGKQIAKIAFTAEENDINIPELPKKSGFTAKWSDFNLSFEDITVYAIYEEIPVSGGWDKTENFEFETQSDGSLTVSKYKGSAKNPVIPSYFDGLPVKSIGALAFSGANICAVKISEGVETIQREAFLNCKNLTTVILPESLKTIEQYAFAYCALNDFELPDGITEIGKQAFYRCNMQNVKLPDSLKVLNNVFWYCDNLENVTAGKNLEIINSDAFYNCKSLTIVELGKNLKTISSTAFNNCPSLEKISIPSSVTVIEPEAFTGCDNLTEVYFENAANWTLYNDNNLRIRDLDVTEISDIVTIAKWLTRNYSSLWWKRN